MHTLPAPLRAERTEALRRILRKLPEPILEALVYGLDSAEELVPGRLYATGNGGCAVGVILRTIFPREDGRAGSAWSRWRRRTLRQTHPNLAREYPHLAALEMVFDRTIEIAERLYPGYSQRELALACGRWMAAEAATELGFRHLKALDYEPVTDAETQRQTANAGA